MAQEKVGNIYEQNVEVMKSVVSTATNTESPVNYSQLLSNGPKSKWIWGENDNKNYFFTKKFQATDVRRAILASSCDNFHKITLNGNLIGQSNNWSEAMQADVTLLLVKSGDNEIVVDAKNEGGPAAFVFKLVLEDSKGNITTIESDSSWNVGNRRNATAPGAVRVVAEYGAQPWGTVFENVAIDPTKGDFIVPEGFQVEKIFTVPRDELG